MEEYAIIASEEIERQFRQGIDPAIYNEIKYYESDNNFSIPGNG